MIAIELTDGEAQAVADTLLAWAADDCPVGAVVDTEALRTANDKLTAAMDSQPKAA